MFEGQRRVVLLDEFGFLARHENERGRARALGCDLEGTEAEYIAWIFVPLLGVWMV